MTFTQLLQILRARWKITFWTLLIVVATTAAVTASLPKKYLATVSVVLDYAEPVLGTEAPSQFSTSYLATQIDIIASPKVARIAAEKLNLASNLAARERFIEETDGRGKIEDWLATALLQDMRVIPARESRVIDIGFTSLDAKFSADVANAFAQAYIETTLELAVEPARQSAEWFDRQLAELRAHLETAQRRLIDYQKRRGIVATDASGDLESSRLTALSQQLAVAELEAQASAEKVKQMEALLARGASPDSLPEVMSNVFIQTLKSQLIQQQTKLNEVKQQVGRNHPEYQVAQSEVENLNSKLMTEMQTVMTGIRNAAKLAAQRKSELAKAIEQRKGEVLEVRGEREELPALMREVDSAQRSYEAALARFNENTLQSRVNRTNVALLTPAVEPIDPSSPRPMLNMALATFLGLFLGVNLSVMTELLRRRVRSAEDLLSAFDIPLLTVLPAAKARKSRRANTLTPNMSAPAELTAVGKSVGQILVDTGKLSLADVERVLEQQRKTGGRFGDAAVMLKLVSPDDLQHALARQFNYPYLRPGEGQLSAELIAAFNPYDRSVEALRMLRSQLMLRWFEAGHKTLAFVSSSAGAGRSFLVANLAVVYSQLGQRTLLIDADLRNARQSALFKLDDNVGLATLLAGRPAEGAIRSLPQFLNLSVLPAGPTPPNPLELLSSPAFRALLDDLRTKYDVILLDTSCAQNSADAQTVAARAGGAVLVARQDVTPLQALRDLEANLLGVGAAVIGVVLNTA